ncbi:hypothetical protein DPMN_052582 [Dreissena polymorpha]|uniref:Uncharacterized protein n=1 Tax=Dreissena polymorpha TaxID=45954 RepID=A0A9D4CLR6_DREPO|nr:hypothetical protein DPMN_052582 [Dreissena polymorpha]
MFIILHTEIVFSPICVNTGFGPFSENKALDFSQEATFRSDASSAPHPQTEMLLSVRGVFAVVVGPPCLSRSNAPRAATYL